MNVNCPKCRVLWFFAVLSFGAYAQGGEDGGKGPVNIGPR